MYRVALSTSLKVSVLSIILVGSSIEVRAEVETFSGVARGCRFDSTETTTLSIFLAGAVSSNRTQRSKTARTLVEGVELNTLSPDARSAIKAIQGAS